MNESRGDNALIDDPQEVRGEADADSAGQSAIHLAKAMKKPAVVLHLKTVTTPFNAGLQRLPDAL